MLRAKSDHCNVDQGRGYWLNMFLIPDSSCDTPQQFRILRFNSLLGQLILESALYSMHILNV